MNVVYLMNLMNAQAVLSRDPQYCTPLPCFADLDVTRAVLRRQRMHIIPA